MAIFGCFGYLTQYSQNVGMSIAIVCMVNNTSVDLLNQTNNFTSVNQSFVDYSNVSFDIKLIKKLKN